MSYDLMLKSEITMYHQLRGMRLNNNDYEQNIVEIKKFRTLKEFFNVYCFIKKPNQMEKNVKISFFKNNERPLWENYIEGGCVFVSLD